MSRIRGFKDGFLPSDPQVSSGPYPKSGFARREASRSSTVPQKSRKLIFFANRSALLGNGFQEMLDNDVESILDPKDVRHRQIHIANS